VENWAVGVSHQPWLSIWKGLLETIQGTSFQTIDLYRVFVWGKLRSCRKL